MGIFKKEKPKSEADAPAGAAVQVGTAQTHPFYQLNAYTPLADGNSRIYRSLREGIPIIDSAIGKIVRLMGGFSFATGNEALDRELNRFFENINVGGNQRGIQAFADNYMDQLLTYGTAIGEMLYDEYGFYALYNGEPEAIEVRRKPDGINLAFFNTSSGTPKPIENEAALLFSVLNPEPGHILGTSLLRGLPFVGDILLRIYNAIGTNWDRVGNLRYAVTYNPKNDAGDKAFAKERAKQMATAWRDAMGSKDAVKDFVAVGDVKVSVIGADNQVLDSEVPVRQLLEQIIAKTGLMPYMFGLSWSTTEKMSQQQADILTTELEAYRRILTPVLQRIAETYLALRGSFENVAVIWEDITLQDQTQMAQARRWNAEADKLTREAEE